MATDMAGFAQELNGNQEPSVSKLNIDDEH
jgi:hypothetical protein